MKSSQTATGVAGTEVRSKARSIGMIIALVMISEIGSFEFNMISPALPEIGKHYPGSQIGWVFTAMLIVGGSSLPIIGRLGDRYGKRLVLLGGTVIMAVGALLCAVSWSFAVMVLGRGLQGFGIVGLVLTYGLVRDLLPPRYVPIGIGAVGTGVGLSAIVGPYIGGSLTEAVGFRAPFLVLAGYAIAMVIVVWLVVPETPVRNPRSINLAGGVSLGAAIGLLIAAVTFSNQRVTLVALGLAALVIFIGSERRSASPLLPLTFLRKRGVSSILILAVLIGGIFNSNVTFIPQILQSESLAGQGDGLGLSPGAYSVYYAIVMGVTGALTGVLAGYVCRRVSPRAAFMVAAAGWLAGSILVATGSVGSIAAVVAVGALFGIGTGGYHSTVSNMVVETVDETDQGLGASLKTTAEQFAGAVVTGVLGVIVVDSVVGTNPSTGTQIRDLNGFYDIYSVYAVMAALALVVAVFMRSGRTPATGGVSGTATLRETPVRTPHSGQADVTAATT